MDRAHSWADVKRWLFHSFVKNKIERNLEDAAGDEEDIEDNFF